MPDLLLELFSEEIPARMQAKAADDLRRMVTDRLVAEGLVYEGAKAFATPRRLALTVHGIPARQSDLKEERKGPRVGGPEAAVQGFLKATGLASLDEAKIQRDPKKGDFYIALIEKPGRATLDVLADILPLIIRTFPWPKQMRWGERSAKSSALTWVRPLHSIVATFGIDTEDPDVVAFDLAGIVAGQTTRGHRFMAPDAFEVRRFEDYDAKLYAAKVVLDPQRRRDLILADAKQLAFAQGYDLVEDQMLLDEVAGLVEWPVVLMGSFDESFLTIPGEVIRATIRNNQKCFVVKQSSAPLPAGERSPLRGSARAGEGALTTFAANAPHPRPLPTEGGGRGDTLAPKFILTANIEASDGGVAIVAGNERVIRARLSDAKFFYETDLKTRLEDRLPKFDKIVFHEKLGTQAERIARIERLAAEIAPLIGADVEKTKRAARLCKADLLTEVVGEFPELQGLMGKYYALAQGEDPAVAAACEDHYKPQGPNDRVPTDPVSIAVALADKIDTLVGFWAIDEKPTGSKDPFALRRAALGVIRLTLENDLSLPLFELIEKAVRPILENQADEHFTDTLETLRKTAELSNDPSLIDKFKSSSEYVEPWTDHVYHRVTEVQRSLRSFVVERLKVQLREKGARFDLVDAVLARPAVSNQMVDTLGGVDFSPIVKTDADDLLMIVRRVEALGKFLDTDDGKTLRAGVKRASNILAIEEKKDKRLYDGAPDAALFRLDAEKALATAIAEVQPEATAAVAREDFAAAMTAMAKLRPAVDAFFEHVKVNDDDPNIRENRLKLLNEIRAATRAVADFSKIQD